MPSSSQELGQTLRGFLKNNTFICCAKKTANRDKALDIIFTFALCLSSLGVFLLILFHLPRVLRDIFFANSLCNFKFINLFPPFWKDVKTPNTSCSGV